MEKSEKYLEGELLGPSMADLEGGPRLRRGIGKLPLEIMATIFTMVCLWEHGKPVEATWGDPGSWFLESRESDCIGPIVMRGYYWTNAPGRLAAVCRDWKQWVYNDAALWSQILIGLGAITLKQGLALLEIMHRTKGRKLDIRLIKESPGFGWVWGERRQELIEKLEEAFAERTEVLRCRVGAFYDHGFENVREFKAVKRVTLDYLNHLDVLPTGRYEDQIRRLVQAELVTHLRLGVIFGMRGHTFTNLKDLQLSEPQRKEDFLVVVASCPNLMSLVLAVGDWEESDMEDQISTNPTVMPLLRTLCVCQVGFCGPCRSLFLNHITAPQLSTLGIPASRHPRAEDSLHHFLERSQCSLYALYIPYPITDLADADAQKKSESLAQLFTMTPDIETLHVVMEPTPVRCDDGLEVHKAWEKLENSAVLHRLSTLVVRIGQWEQSTLTPAEANTVADGFLDAVARRIGTGQSEKGSLRSAKLLMALERAWGSSDEWEIGRDREEQRQRLIDSGMDVLEVQRQGSPIWTDWGR
ncbi:hypothetical protein PM082_019370 [Marasmius tenuissimus]|nr:hypothetical protein PM082_019272 [Marasmius tenuissimus]KAJ8075043.1 hypothetical protein PM082_019370 [Marasmius tenuissimus]